MIFKKKKELDLLNKKYDEITFLEILNSKIVFQTDHSKKINYLPSLDTNKWQNFQIKDLFEISGTTTTPCCKIKNKGCYHYVTTKSTDNGVEELVDFFTEYGNVLTIDSAVNGFCSFQENNFIASDHVEKIMPSVKKIIHPISFNKYVALFFVTILRLEQWRYYYGRAFNQTRIKQTNIKLPINSSGKPDLEFIERYIKSLPYSEFI